MQFKVTIHSSIVSYPMLGTADTKMNRNIASPAVKELTVSVQNLSLMNFCFNEQCVY